MPVFEATSRDARRSRGGVLWLALALSFSPVLADLVRHLAANPWALYVAVFPPLFARCALRERPAEPSVTMGAALLAAGLLIELVAAGGGVVRLGRLGLPLAAIGLSRAFGLASLPVSLLSLWWLPVPHALLQLFSPALESTWQQLAARPLQLAGLDVAAGVGVARAGAAELALSSAEGGLPLAALLSGIGWYASASTGDGLWRCARRAASWGMLAFPLQLAAIGLAVSGLVLGVPGDVLQILLQLLWIPVAVGGLLVSESRLRARGGGR